MEIDSSIYMYVHVLEASVHSKGGVVFCYTTSAMYIAQDAVVGHGWLAQYHIELQTGLNLATCTCTIDQVPIIRTAAVRVPLITRLVWSG